MAVRRLITTVIAAGALLVPAGAAFGAVNTTVQGYSATSPAELQVSAPKGPAPQNLVAANTAQPQPAATPAPATVQSKGSLPFTGLDVRVIVLAGIVLAGVGFGLRRLSRHNA